MLFLISLALQQPNDEQLQRDERSGQVAFRRGVDHRDLPAARNRKLRAFGVWKMNLSPSAETRRIDPGRRSPGSEKRSKTIRVAGGAVPDSRAPPDASNPQSGPATKGRGH
jgi:hypothetical protein